MLGIMHEFGQGAPRDLVLAERYYRAAAAQGNAVARKNVALLHMKTGQWFRGFREWLSAFIYIYRIVRVNPNDPRLKIR